MRVELTKRGDYAVRAMLALAHAGDQLVSAPVIAADMSVPPRFLPQVMGDLVRAELVESVPGRTGGYRLSRPAPQITLLDVIEAIEGDSRRVTCVLRGGPCGRDGFCAVHDAFMAAEEALLERFEQVTLAAVAARHYGPASQDAGDGRRRA